MQFKYIIAALMVMVCLLAPTMMVVKAEKSVMGCEICEWLIATAENLANKTKPQIEQELLQICSKLGPYEQICDQMVLMELPDIIDQIIAKEPPALVCAQIKMCSNSSVVVPAVPKAQDSGICNMCQLVVNQVENWVASNDTIMTLEKKLEQVCTVIPGQYSTLCTYAVEQYLPTFIHQVEKQYPALVICQDVSLCSKQEAAPVVVAPQQSAELCPICKAAVGFLKTKISTVDVATVKKQLEFACTFFQVPDCQTLVDKAAEIAQAVQTEDANTICSTIVDVCPKKVEWNPFKKFLEAKNAKYCPTCVAITQYLENAITSDVAVAELIKLADIGCAKLGPLSGLCTKFVPLAVDELKKLILEKVTPQKVCSTLKMCDSSDKMSIAAPVPEVQVDSSLCVPCEYVIGVADNWLIANNTEQSIQNTLDMVCTDFVPSVYQSQCIALVNQYAPQLIQLFEAKVFNPQTVCKAIGVCTSQKRAAINKQIKMN